MNSLIRISLLMLFVILCLPVLSNGRDNTTTWSGLRADYIIVDKSQKRLTLFHNGKEIKSYRIALGRNPSGPKLMQGDRRTPEGHYIIDGRNPDSDYHLSLHISYPNEIDREITDIADVPAGNNIMIHGAGPEYAWMGKFHVVLNWTDGCIAVTNDEIEEIWSLVPDGTPIEIRP